MPLTLLLNMTPASRSARNTRYWVTMDMETELRGTCHFARVNDIIFPADCSDLFITCSVADIRVWNATLRQELLRIQVLCKKYYLCMYYYEVYTTSRKH